MPCIGLSLGLAQSGWPVDASTTPSVQVIPLADGTVEASFSGGILTLIIDVPSAYAGTHQIAASELDTGPVAIVPPQIEGDPVPGGSLTLSRDGLWAYSGDTPALTRVWQRDGVVIPGAADRSYTIEATDQGAALHVVEELSDANGVRIVASNPFDVPSPSLFDVSFTAHGSTDYGASAITTLTVPALALGDPHPSREIFAVVGLIYGPPSSLADIIGVTIAGISATRVVADDPPNGPIEIWRAAVPSGTTGDVVVTTDQGCLAVGAATFRAIEARKGSSHTDSVAAGAALTLSVPMAAGSVVIAGAKSANSGALSFAGVTQIHGSDIRTSDFFATGLAVAPMPEAPRLISVSAASPGNIGGVAVVLEAV